MFARNRLLLPIAAALTIGGCSRSSKFSSGSRSNEVPSQTSKAAAENAVAQVPSEEVKPAPVITASPVATDAPPPVLVKPQAGASIALSPLQIIARDAPVKFLISEKAVPTGLDSFSFRLTDLAGNKTNFGKKIPYVQNDAGIAVELNDSLPEGRYIVEAVANDENDAQLDKATARLIIDRTPPKLALYLGADAVANPCTNPPTPRAKVSTRETPFEFCAIENDLGNSGLTDFCILANGSSSEVPDTSHACWVKIEKVLKHVLLANGKNNFVAFAKDAAGNVATASGTVDLEIAPPPRLDFTSPLFSELALRADGSKPWNSDETKILAWNISPKDDTPKNKVRYVVSLINSTDNSLFFHLGCNFSNDSIWNACPEGAAQSDSRFFVPDGKNGVVGDLAFLLVIPKTLPINAANPYYSVVITSIDLHGNAAVTSTAEINAGWEVVAGRTYKGFGASGQATEIVQETSGGYDVVKADKHGQVYSVGRNIKTLAFDGRVCRPVALPSLPARTSFDCPDMIKTEIDILKNPYWVYNPSKDVFYTFVANNDPKLSTIVQIDFNSKTVTPIFGGAGKKPLGQEVPAGALASEYGYSTGLHMSRMFFDVNANKLVFRQDGQLFAIDIALNTVTYFLGSVASLKHPSAAEGLARAEVKLPDEYAASPFAISDDGRLMISGIYLEGSQNGNSQGAQYVYSGVSYTKKDALISVLPLSQKSVDMRDFIFTDIDFDATRRTFHASIGASGLFKLDLPDITKTSRDDYTWNPMLVAADFQPTDPDKTWWTFSFASLPGSGIFYLYNRFNGAIVSFVPSTGKHERVLGADPNLATEGELAVNRFLSIPRSLAIDRNGNLLFNDQTRLQKIELTPGANAKIYTLKNDFPPHYFRYNAANHSVLQFTSDNGNLATLMLDGSANPAPVTFGNMPTKGMGYRIQEGFSVLNPHRFAVRTANYDPNADNSHGQGGRTSYAYFGFAEVNPALPSNNFISLSASDEIATGELYCGGDGKSACVQAAKVGIGIPTASFRLGVFSSSNPEWGQPLGTMAFDDNDDAMLTCLNSVPTKIKLSSRIAIPVHATLPDGTAVQCSEYFSHFLSFENKIYFTQGSGFYVVDTSKIETEAKAVFTPVLTTGPMFDGRYGGFIRDNNYVYYTDPTKNRVLRNKLK